VARRRAGLDALLGGLVRGRAALVSWDVLALRPELAAPFAHVFALDPPPVADPERLLAGLPGPGLAHLGWGEPERAFALAALEARRDVRATVAAVYRALRDAVATDFDALVATVSPAVSAADCGAALRALREVGLVEAERGSLRVLDAAPTQLERSPAYRAHVARLEAAHAALGGAPATPIAA
jgi:hypothetical protein